MLAQGMVNETNGQVVDAGALSATLGDGQARTRAEPTRFAGLPRFTVPRRLGAPMNHG
ncbi:hypothetical protein FHS43_005917 [Streptosporangium becharense]|uniref:Uncharacterized protein n=1 Tax=Streptosporangium becharense TaxID=1816182 RepID=A0A7W9MJV2_9ACTN|nr:hypothetical protein [Streptosporangium becharense]MBB5823450.1 hypothetical protein [Streptosporangium becharense]